MLLSYSQLQTYRRCPKQYEYAFVKKNPRQISPGESFGSSIHNTLKKFGELELTEKKKNPPSREQLSLLSENQTFPPEQAINLTTLITLWRECFIAAGYVSRAETDARLMQGEAMLRLFFDWWSEEERTVIGIETGFKLSIPGVAGELTLSGRIDRTERTKTGIRIIDYKTTPPVTQPQADADLQLSLYAMAAQEKWGEAPTELILLFINEEGVTERKTQRNTGQRKDALAAIRNIHEHISSRDFRPVPSVNTCRGCPYKFICGARAV